MQSAYSTFFRLLPRTTDEAAALARRHDYRLANRNETRALCQMPIRHALEVRHASFAVPAFVDLLREHQIAVCVADSAGLYLRIREVTADFVYVRLHGATQLYASGYGPTALARWAGEIRAWLGARAESTTDEVRTRIGHHGSDVFVYFDNDLKVRAPFDAINLQRLLEGRATKRLPPGLTGRAATPIVVGQSWRGMGKRRP